VASARSRSDLDDHVTAVFGDVRYLPVPAVDARAQRAAGSAA